MYTLAVGSLSNPASIGSADEWVVINESISALAIVLGRVSEREMRRKRRVAVVDATRKTALHFCRNCRTTIHAKLIAVRKNVQVSQHDFMQRMSNKYCRIQ